MNSLIAFIRALPRRCAVFLIQCYQLVISPHFPGSCRFRPTCSEYGIIALKRFGLIKGTYLTVRRILRCRPGGDYGYDPVPDTFSLKLKR